MSIIAQIALGRSGPTGETAFIVPFFAVADKMSSVLINKKLKGHMIKRIRVWKTIVLSIVTLGIYTLVWFARRRDEMVKYYKVSIPHWLWLIAPTPLSILVFFGLCIVFPYKIADFSDPIFTFLVGSILFLILLVSCIQFWWMWQFGKAVEKITQGKLTLGWIVAYVSIWGLATQYLFQYYFNRLPKKAEIGSKKYKPSQKFVSSSILVIFVSIVLWSGAVILLFIVSEDSAPIAPQLTKEQYSKLSKSNALAKEYDSCIEKLNSDFPAEEADDMNEDDYNKAYDNCEDIRIKQNVAADEYNKSVGR